MQETIRRAGDKVRIAAQLIDGNTEQYLWADNYDRELKDIFSIQNEVAKKVVSELAVGLTASESERQARKHAGNFEAYDMYLRARRAHDGVREEDHLKAAEFARKSIELDPNFAGGYAALSYVTSRSIRFGFSALPKEDLEKAYELAKKAVSIDETFSDAHLALASAYLMKERHDEAVAVAMKAARIQPGNSYVHTQLGFFLHWAGRGEEAVEAIKRGRQLNPKYLEGPDPIYLSFMAFACFTAGFYEEAIEAMRQCIDRYGPAVPRHPFLIASYVSLGRDEEAKDAVQQLLKTNPNFSLESWKYGRTYKNPEDIERLYSALRKAGLK